jgi:hypothetical protein
LGYLSTAGIGISVLIWPPFNSVTHLLGGWLSVVWALFILTSLFCIPATIMGRWKVEYTLIPFFTTALLVAVVSVWMRSGGDPLAIPRACTATALIFAYAARYTTLNRIVNAGKAVSRGKRWTRS